MEELSPEKILDHVAQIRESNTTAVDLTVSYEDSSDEEEVEEKKAQSTQRIQDSFQQVMDEVETKEAAVMPTMQRGERYDPPGAFTSGGRTRPRAGGEQSVASAPDPPIHAVLVESSSDEESTINDIYTAEPMSSTIFKESFVQRKWSTIICLCMLGIMATIPVSVYLTIEVVQKLEDGGSDKSKSKGSGEDGDSGYYSRHALVLGTNAWNCDADDSTIDSSLLQVEFDCNFARTEVVGHSPDVDCEETDTGSFSCGVAILDPVTTTFVLLHCERPPGRSPLRQGDLAVSVTVQVPSECWSGDRAIARLVSFCDDPSDPEYTSGGTACVDSRRVTNVPRVLGGCERACIDGCTFQALEYSVCKPTKNALNENEVLPVVTDMRSNITTFLLRRQE